MAGAKRRLQELRNQPPELKKLGVVRGLREAANFAASWIPFGGVASYVTGKALDTTLSKGTKALAMPIAEEALRNGASPAAVLKASGDVIPRGDLVNHVVKRETLRDPHAHDVFQHVSRATADIGTPAEVAAAFFRTQCDHHNELLKNPTPLVQLGHKKVGIYYGPYGLPRFIEQVAAHTDALSREDLVRIHDENLPQTSRNHVVGGPDPECTAHFASVGMGRARERRLQTLLGEHTPTAVRSSSQHRRPDYRGTPGLAAAA